MPFSEEETTIRAAIRDEYDFFQHCKKCPPDIHCCTRPQNVVIVREREKPHLEEAYAALKHSSLPSEDDRLEFEDLGEGLSRLKEKNGRCPMFTEDQKCSVHAQKPLDCLLWPTMFAVDESNGPITLDVKCPAVRSSEIPPRFYELTLAVTKLLSSEQRSVYAQENRDSYKEGRIVNVQALGPHNAQEVLSKWDNIKKPIEDAIDSIWEKLERKLSPLRYDSEDVLSVFKWILAITIGLGLEQSFKLSYQVFLSDAAISKRIENNDLYNFILTQFDISPAIFIVNHKGFIGCFAVVTLALFLFDAFRVLVPLPWIFKSFRKRSMETGDPTSLRLPAFDVSKLGFISVATIYVFFFAAQTFILLNVYFTCLLVAHVLDFFWYISLDFLRSKDPKSTTDFALHRIEQCQEDLNNKLADLVGEKIITSIQGTTRRQAAAEQVAAATEAARDLGNVLRHEMSELKGSNKERADGFRRGLPLLLNKWQEYLEAKAQIKAEVRVRSSWSRISGWDFVSCLAVLSPVLPLLSHLPARLLLWLVGVGVVSHVANIIYDYWRNHDEYYSTLMLLYRTPPITTQKPNEFGVPTHREVGL